MHIVYNTVQGQPTAITAPPPPQIVLPSAAYVFVLLLQESRRADRQIGTY